MISSENFDDYMKAIGTTKKDRERGEWMNIFFLITEATVIYSNNSRKSISILNYPYKNSSRFFHNY